MDPNGLLYVMTAFVIIAAIALCIQAGMLAAMYRTTKAMQTQIQPLLPKVESLVDTTKTAVEQSRKQITDVTKQANEILTIHQAAACDGGRCCVADASIGAKVQLERVELVLDDSLNSRA